MVLDTVSAPYDVAFLVSTLEVEASFILLGRVGKPLELSALPLLFNRHAIEGSFIGGVPETQEILDFRAAHNIIPVYKVNGVQNVDKLFQAMIRGTSGDKRSVVDESPLVELIPVAFAQYTLKF